MLSNDTNYQNDGKTLNHGLSILRRKQMYIKKKKFRYEYHLDIFKDSSMDTYKLF